MEWAHSVKKEAGKRFSHFFILTLSVFVIFFVIYTFSIRNAYSAEVTLAWDQNSEPDIAGYRIYYGLESRSYPNVVDIGNYTSCVIAELEEGGIYFFAATAYSTSGVESDYSNEVSHTFIQQNEPPTANAGPDQTVNEGSAVTLNGSKSFDSDDGIAGFQWTQIDGPSVTLSNSTAVSPAFTAPDVNVESASLTFQLTVTDNSGMHSTDTCRVNVIGENEPPTSNAGVDQIVTEGFTIVLDGSNSSDPDDDIVSYRWSQISGPLVTLSSTTAISPTFIAPDGGGEESSLIFQLTVTDSGGLRSSDTCIVTIISNNNPPVADAGFDQTVNERTTVMLDASRSFDPDNAIVSYRWLQIEGTPAGISDPTAVNPVFTAPDVKQKGAVLIFELAVIDDGGLQSTDICTVVVENVNLPPGLNKDKNIKIE